MSHLAAIALIVQPGAQLPPWLMFAAGAALFVGGVVIYLGGQRRAK